MGAGRGAALGDSLARILAHAGYEVQREYYVNDAGARMESFFSTLFARYQQQLDIPAQLPADGYAGEYMVELAGEIVQEHGRRFLETAPGGGSGGHRQDWHREDDRPDPNGPGKDERTLRALVLGADPVRRAPCGAAPSA